MRLRSLTVLLALLFAAPVLAQTSTTGRIVGTIMDQQGAVVPGVNVTASSPQLQGTRTSATDGAGEFRLLALPPGTYSVKAEMSGFKTVERNDIPVDVNATVTLPLTMTIAGLTQAVTVSASAVSSAVDTTSTLGGISANADILKNLPLGRDFYAVARLAPGSAPDAVGASGERAEYANKIGPNMYGGTGAENQYIIDGLNVTGMNGGEQVKTVNNDFVQEVQVMTTGLNAEYGRTNGGIINVVTQSGGNEFHGSAFGFYSGRGLISNNGTASQRALTTTTILDSNKPLRDGGGSLGGYLVKDRLWFFGAYDRQASRDLRTVIRPLTAVGSPALGSSIPSNVTLDNYAAKLTWRASTNHTLWVATNGEPSTRSGYIFAIAGPASTWQGTLKRGAPNVNFHYDGQLGAGLILRGVIGRDREKTTYGGAGSSTPQSINALVTPNISSGGFGGYTNQDFKRTIYKGDVSKFWGAHEIKAGGDFENVLTGVQRFDGGAGQTIRAQSSGGVVMYRHRMFVNDLASGFVRTDPATWVIANPLTASPKDQNTSFYAQDSYKVLSNFTVNYGIRWERQHGFGRNNFSAYDMKQNWAPRVGFVWDPTKTAKAKVFASFGRYFDNMPLDMNIREFGGELECFCWNFDPGSGFIPDPTTLTVAQGGTGTAPPVFKSTLRGGGIEATDPKMKGMYSDEWTGGVEYELRPYMSIGARVIRRSLGRAIEDFLNNDTGVYYIGNPSEGTFGLVMGSFAGTSVPAPKPRRNDTAVELTLRKRYSNNWQFLASYVWDTLEGNYDGTYQVSTGQLDPGINSAYDYADFMVNSRGHLSSERKNQLKLDGSYTLSSGMFKGLTVGASFHWFSGFPLTAYGYSPAYSNWEYYLTPRGSLGHGPADYESDVQVHYPIRLSTTVNADVSLAAFNLLDRQSINQLYAHYNEVADGACAGIPAGLCNGDGGLEHVPGTITPVGQLTNPLTTTTTADFLHKGVGFTTPRSIRLGVRLTF